nr:putative mitochondrial protein [Tanacetum cinerariifolium]
MMLEDGYSNVTNSLALTTLPMRRSVNGENMTWEVNKNDIVQIFGSIFEDPMSALKNAKYEKTAKEYQDLFDTLLCRVTISQEHAMSLYLGGLPTELEMNVRMFKPATLADAYSLTKLQKGCEMVLAIQWLATLGDIKCNFKELRMEFKYEGKKVQLRGMLMKVDEKIKIVLKNYEDVFGIPVELPPQRSHDHRIPLVKGALPVNIRPYRHPATQKDAIESMVKSYWKLELLKRVTTLNTVIEKGAYEWNSAAQAAFEALKQAMISALVLKLPDFTKDFTVEIDASGGGIGAVLLKGGHPITFLSKTLSAKHQLMSTYEKEFLAVVVALEKWRGYLLDRYFKIKTDYISLKYLIDQRMSTLTQLKWLPKLMGFEFVIVYKKGVDNVTADVLSRLHNHA